MTNYRALAAGLPIGVTLLTAACVNRDLAEDKRGSNPFSAVVPAMDKRPRVVAKVDSSGAVRSVQDSSERQQLIARRRSAPSPIDDAETARLLASMRQVVAVVADRALPDGAASWIVVAKAQDAPTIVLAPDCVEERFLDASMTVLAANLPVRSSNAGETIVSLSRDLTWSTSSGARMKVSSTVPEGVAGAERSERDARLRARISRDAITVAGIPSHRLNTMP